MTSTNDTTAAPLPTPRIVVGIDGSLSSIGALLRGVRLAEALGVNLVAITSWQYPHTSVPYVDENWSPQKDAEAILADTVRTVFNGQVPDWFHGQTREGPAAPVLIDASKGADMLIVGSRGRGGFAGLLLGSVSTVCAEHASCPVLVFHDPSLKDK